MRRLAAAFGVVASLGGTPYLDRHADDAVRFRPFGEAAFAEAREKNRLVFVSVGFFACNGCHVMEAESFEDPALGALFEERVVPIPDTHDPTNLDAAFRLALDTDHYYTGVFYRNDSLATMGDKLDVQRRHTMDRQPRTLEALISSF